MGLGFNDLKVIEVRDLLSAIRDGSPAFPDFLFAHKIAQTVDGILLSAEEGRWVTLDEL